MDSFKTPFIATMLGLSALCCNPAYADLIVNGDFSVGNSGFDSEYLYSPGNIKRAETYDIVTDPAGFHGSATPFGDRTSGDGMMMAVNGSTTTDGYVWIQTVDVVPNKTYAFSIWISTWHPESPATLRIIINSSPISLDFVSPQTAGIWERHDATWHSQSSSTATISVVNISTQFIGNDFAMDDITFRDDSIFEDSFEIDSDPIP